MSGKLYQISFSGETLEGQNIAEVKKKLQALLKVDANGIERFFTGKPVVVKKDVTQEIASQYAKAFEKAGAKCRIGPIPDSVAGSAAAQKAAPAPKQEQKEILPSGEVAAYCPKCNYKQRENVRCIRCGADMKGDESASPQNIKPKPLYTPGASNLSASASSKQSQIASVKAGELILTNLESIPGTTIIEHFGVVSGSTIRAKHIGRDIMASLKNLVGGELKGYTELLQESREEAVNRMKQQAKQLGANAILNVRFSTSSITQGAAELYAYGTAVRIE